MSDETTAGAVNVRGPDAPLRTYMSTEIVFAEPSATVRDVARLIIEASVGCVVIGSATRVEAVLSERDIARAVADRVDLDAVRAGDLGSHHLVWADIDDTVGNVAEEMMEDYVRHVLVRDADGLAGVVSMRDVLSAYAL